MEVDVAGLAHAFHHMIARADRRLHVDAERERHLRAPEQHLVDGLLEGQRGSEPVTQHLHDDAAARQPEIGGQEGAEILLAGIGPRLSDHDRPDVRTIHPRVGNGLDDDPCEQLMLDDLERVVRLGLVAPDGQRTGSNDRRPLHHLSVDELPPCNVQDYLTCIMWKADMQS